MSGSVRPAVTAAVIGTLTGDSALTTQLGGAKAWVNVPDKTPAPYVFVMGGREIPAPGATTLANKSRRNVLVHVTAVSAQRGTAQIDALLDRVIELLAPEGSPGPAVVGGKATWRLVENREPRQMEDVADGSLVWMGTALFDVQVL